MEAETNYIVLLTDDQEPEDSLQNYTTIFR